MSAHNLLFLAVLSFPTKGSAAVVAAVNRTFRLILLNASILSAKIL